MLQSTLDSPGVLLDGLGLTGRLEEYRMIRDGEGGKEVR